MEQIFANVMMSLTSLPGLLAFLAYVLGIVCIIGGSVTVFKVFKLKQKGNVNRAFFLIFFGAFCFCFPSVFEWMTGMKPPLGAVLSLPFLILAIASLLPIRSKKQKD